MVARCSTPQSDVDHENKGSPPMWLQLMAAWLRGCSAASPRRRVLACRRGDRAAELEGLGGSNLVVAGSLFRQAQPHLTKCLDGGITRRKPCDDNACGPCNLPKGVTEVFFSPLQVKAPGETLDPVLPGSNDGTTCGVYPLGAIVLEMVLPGGTRG